MSSIPHVPEVPHEIGMLDIDHAPPAGLSIPRGTRGFRLSLAAFAAACLATMLTPLSPAAQGFNLGVRIDFVYGSNPNSIAIGDLNGDGAPDLVAANNGANTVSVLLGNGASGFGAKTDFAAGAAPISLAIGDVNGDGRPDVREPRPHLPRLATLVFTLPLTMALFPTMTRSRSGTTRGAFTSSRTRSGRPLSR